MSISKPVPREFAEDFETVAAHYGLRERGEYDAVKAAARADIESAIDTFTRLAAEVKEGTA